MVSFARIVGVLAGLALPLSAAAQDISVTWLRQQVPAPPVLSNLDPIPGDAGIQGARLGLEDNQTTAKFLGQTWALKAIDVPEGGPLLDIAAEALLETPFLILDAPARDTLAVADLPGAEFAVIFNTAAPERSLRDAECRANMLHTLPSRAMLADALMQWLVQRRWTDLAMIHGVRPGDVALAAQFDASAAKFGLKIGQRKAWAYDADMRRSAGAELPLFTQPLGDYDALVVADEADDFARYIPFNTWHPRPVVGSEGLRPRAWDRVIEQWGAAQLQSRFTGIANRAMLPRDYAAWAAMRALGEAVTRTKSDNPVLLREYMLSPDFALAGFLGRPLSFRAWNGQMRQPIALVGPRAQVDQAPLDGFLHPVSALDTLGLDAPETACTAFD